MKGELRLEGAVPDESRSSVFDLRQRPGESSNSSVSLSTYRLIMMKALGFLTLLAPIPLCVVETRTRL
jgi:hypothetical protein